MNSYSTLKKTVGLSFAALMFVGVANAQTDSTSTEMTTSTEPTAAKVFGGAGQYNKFSIGVNAGVTSNATVLGGPADFAGSPKINLGYGLSFRQQFSHVFGVVLDLNGGKVAGERPNVTGGTGSNQGFRAFETNFWQGALSAHFNVASISFLRRKNAVNFFAKAGAGLAMYKPKISTDATPAFTNFKANDEYVKEYVIPVGVGAKFRLSNAVALNLGYNITFVDGDNFDGHKKSYPATFDRYSYGYAGLEFTLGSGSKANIDWVNPVAMMYDELYDPALRAEVEALKGRVSAVETAVSDLKKDSDGDGVSDQFDKCPNTPAGTVVDGAGCAIVFPGPGQGSTESGAAYSNIQFEFDSSVLRTSAYPALDATSADLRSSGATVTVKGYASSEGTAAHNMQLSKDRANSVKTYLVNSGVDAKKVKVKGYGETNPVADNSTEEGRVLNRRVEFAK
ncbi:OmpA family protein [Mucilaginibacter hurinus]|uniref:OmpA family protein n=1 Tax=Mucilaginibacter hurinus TaxID=2201324 RepID=A0A367GM68_9SPHI|nr:OmpA family protein [Mucilaginibacter hurinus]RCH54564.1 OmpA family protein [Mucilaginibacter hurinus]